MNRPMGKPAKQHYAMIAVVLLFVVVAGVITSWSTGFDHTHKVVVPGIATIYEDIPNPPLVTISIWIGWLTMDALICVVIYYLIVHD